ncbi:MAG: putative signaling protein [Candidatus Erwinia impunctatus]|nr:putative signaling protein [Culicoides impunctatus]
MNKYNIKKSREKLSVAIGKGEFIPFFQPIVSLSDQRIVGFELLARYRDEDDIIVRPDTFMAEITKFDLFDEMMISIIYQTSDFIKLWPHDLFVSVNVSPIQLKNNNVVQIIKEFIDEIKLTPKRLKIEITETALINDMVSARKNMNELASMGCLICMDDFGTGFSSLTWLSELPIETIKIDMSFIRTMLQKKLSRKIVTSIVGLGQNLGIEVVAEGIENEYEADMLREIGCQFAQGYFFGKPMPGPDTLTILSSDSIKSLHGKLGRMSVDQRAWQMSSMYDAPNLSICFIDKNMFIVDVSETFTKRVNFNKQDLLNKHIYEVFPSEKKRFMWLREFREKGLPYPPFEFVLPNGEVDVVILTRVEDEAHDLMGFCIFALIVDEVYR